MKLMKSAPNQAYANEQEKPWDTTKEPDREIATIEDEPDMFEAAIAAIDSKREDSGWYLDIGASIHVTGSKEACTDLANYSGTVRTASG
jgi:hypothetical protein